VEAYFDCPDGCKLYYRLDDFTDPWRASETVLFVHGLAESGEAWRAWVPHFARRYRVVRIDLRGFGRSTPMPADFNWTMDVLLDDLIALIMQGRLGSNVSQAEFEWWIENVQGKTPASTLQGYLRWVPGLDIRADVDKITCPALIITTTGSGLRTVDSVKAWQSRIKSSQLVMLEGDAWHAAGAYPDRCAQATLSFLEANP